MRLFHVSEEPNIQTFEPRIPNRNDLDKNVGLVWAIDEARLPNFLTPRDCPRVAYYIGENTTEEDKEKFFSSSTISHALVIESKWFDKMTSTTVYLYEFSVDDFVQSEKEPHHWQMKYSNNIFHNQFKYGILSSTTFYNTPRRLYEFKNCHLR